MPRSIVRRLLAYLLLALALLGMQHGAIAHAFSHADEQRHRQEGTPDPKPDCKVCHAYAAADAGESQPSIFLFDAALAGQAIAASSPEPHAATRVPAFRSRAPPATP